jgi:hypothetical protein
LVEGISKVYWFGSEGDYNAMVTDLLGPSLEELKTFCGNEFTTKTILMLGIQLVALFNLYRYKESKVFTRIHTSIEM